MLFGKDKDVPGEVSKVGLGKWYLNLSDQNKVRLGRYLKDSDTSSQMKFLLSVMDGALKDENDAFVVTVGEYAAGIAHGDMEKYDVNEKLVLAYYNLKKYDECLKCCDLGLSLVPKVKKELFARAGGNIPENIYCRNYKLNVLVGIMFDYDNGDKALDEYCEMGILSKEDLEYRKQSNRIFRLQRTFDGLYAIKIKED